MEAQSTISQELIDIKPGIGLGSIKFGMTRDQITDLLGEPADKEKFAYEEEVSESWHYDKLNMSIAFDEMEAWKLTTISVTSDEYKMEGTSIVGISREDLFSKFESMNLSDIEVEDWSETDETKQELVAADEVSMNFFVDGGNVREVQWGPDFSEDDEIIWPA